MPLLQKKKIKINFVQYNAKTGARDGVRREPLTSKDPIFPLSSP